MKRLTVRTLGPELERRLREVARRRDTSLNKAALYLMRSGADLRGVDGQPPAAGAPPQRVPRHLDGGRRARRARRRCRPGANGWRVLAMNLTLDTNAYTAYLRDDPGGRGGSTRRYGSCCRRR